jgi:hypothetical protein
MPWVVQNDHYARMIITVAATRITSSCAGVPPLHSGASIARTTIGYGYNKRYEEMDKKHRSAGLYADTTKQHIDRIE